MIPTGLLILGFGGHARSVADVALRTGIASLIFFDERGLPNERFAGFPVTNERPSALGDGWFAMPALGDNLRRQQQMIDTLSSDWKIATLVSPLAYIGVDATIGTGTIVAHGAHVGPLALIGEGCIINTTAVVEHECCIGEYSHISVSAAIAGRCTLGRRVFIGAGAVVIDGIQIADDVTVGAGSVVVDHIVEPGTYAGTPARAVKTRSASLR